MPSQLDDLKEILQPIAQRLGSLESQERIHSDAYEVDASFNWTLPGDLTILGTFTGGSIGATHLVPGRFINGVFFDGTADITLPTSLVDAADLIGTVLASNVVTSSLTSLGTLNALTVVGAGDITGDVAIEGITTVWNAARTHYLGFKIAESASDYIPDSVLNNAMMKFSHVLVAGGPAGVRMQLHPNGEFFLGNTALSFVATATNLVDFWFNATAPYLATRSVRMADRDNRVQLFGSRYVRPGGADDGHTIANASVGTGESLFAIIGAGSLYDASQSYPLTGSFGEILFIPDNQGFTFSTTNRPGAIVFSTNQDGVAAPTGNAERFGDVYRTVFRHDGSWLFGIKSDFSSTNTALADFNHRLNVHYAPGNSQVPALAVFHGSTPAAGNTGQTIEHNWFVRGTTGGVAGWLNNARMEIGKVNDFLGAANQNSFIRFRVMAAGTLGPILDLLPDGIDALNFIRLPASTTTRPSLRIPSGTAPSAPTSGDFWYDGTNLKFRDGATTRTLTWV